MSYIVEVRTLEGDTYLGSVYDFRDYMKLMDQYTLQPDEVYGTYSDGSVAPIVDQWGREYVSASYHIQETANDISRQQHPPLPEDRIL